MAAGPAAPLLAHPGAALAAAAVGVALALAYAVAEYLLLPAWRLRAARRRGPRFVSGLIRQEKGRLRRVRDRAAVLEEHGRAGAGELRTEARLRTIVLAAMERRAGSSG